MGVLTRWRAGRATAYREQIAVAAAGDDAEEAARARDRAVVVARLQCLPADKVLYLRPDEWRDCPGRPPGTYIDVRVHQIGDQITVDERGPWVGVTGHHLECAWLDDGGHPPCIALVARVEAVLRPAP